MRRDVFVTIDCQDTTCGKCEFVFKDTPDNKPVCVLYSDKKNPENGVVLKHTKSGVMRCAKCIKQEIPEDDPEDELDDELEDDEDEEDEEDEDEDEEDDQ